MSFENAHWKLRALAMTRGNHTLMGAILLAIIGHKPSKRPYYSGLAEISKDGVVWAKLHPKNLLIPRKVPICTVEMYKDELKRLADLCKMDDREVAELLDEAKKWIARDHRAQSMLH